VAAPAVAQLLQTQLLGVRAAAAVIAAQAQQALRGKETVDQAATGHFGQQVAAGAAQAQQVINPVLMLAMVGLGLHLLLLALRLHTQGAAVVVVILVAAQMVTAVLVVEVMVATAAAAGLARLILVVAVAVVDTKGLFGQTELMAVQA